MTPYRSQPPAADAVAHHHPRRHLNAAQALRDTAVLMAISTPRCTPPASASAGDRALAALVADSAAHGAGNDHTLPASAGDRALAALVATSAASSTSNGGRLRAARGHG